ncbi:unnamed protein product [Arabis nemorensis]|uniref:Uncharacterized protein n=1 Tax=Arabis nemorensis TaxID=586526 RepID=A0A565BYQ5_9BRAS|nr:unnamed protein product [Arabis nemorensis]
MQKVEITCSSIAPTQVLLGEILSQLNARPHRSDIGVVTCPFGSLPKWPLRGLQSHGARLLIIGSTRFS